MTETVTGSGVRLSSALARGRSSLLDRPLVWGATGAACIALGGAVVGPAPIALRGMFGRGFVQVPAVGLTYLGIALLVAAWLAIGAEIRAGRPPSRAQLTATVVAWALPLAIGSPLFSRDVYSYAAQGQMVVRGSNPYRFGPIVLGSGKFLSAVSPTWLNTRAPYGPLFVGLDAFVVRHAANNLVAAVIGLRLLSLVGVALIAVFLPRLAARHGVPATTALWLGVLNPLILLHFVNGAHNDALMLGLLVAGGPAGASAAAPGPAPRAATAGSIGLRLLDVPVTARDDPRARLYIVDHLAPGTVIHRRIEVSNTTASTVHIVLYPAAATIGKGSFVGAAGHTPNDLTTWASVRPDASDVPAGGRVTATVTITVPRDAAPGEQYGVVWAEARSAPPAGGGITQVSRVGIRLYLSVGPGGPPAANFTIDSLTAKRSPDGRPMVVASVHNTGGRALDMNGTLQLSAGPGGLSAGPFPANLGVTLAIGDTEPSRSPWTSGYPPARGTRGSPCTADCSKTAHEQRSRSPRPRRRARRTSRSSSSSSCCWASPPCSACSDDVGT